MPGVVRCGRCGGSVHADAVAIETRPPRASARAKRWRRETPQLSGASARAGEGLARARHEILGHWQPEHVPESSLIWRMIVPGWPQWYGGHTLRGQLFLGVYLVLLAGALLFAGTVLGSLMLGLAVSCHVSSILDIALMNVHEVGSRVVRIVMAFVAVVMLIYLPLGWLIGQVASPQRIVMDAPPFHAGDVVLINSRAFRTSPPQAGDVVEYEIRRTRVNGVTGAGLNAQVIIAGAHIDRVLAVGGQQVECRDGVLHVDGTPSVFHPLNPSWSVCPLNLTVPADHFLIVPSTNPRITPGDVRDVCLVPGSAITGSVFL